MGIVRYRISSIFGSLIACSLLLWVLYGHDHRESSAMSNLIATLRVKDVEDTGIQLSRQSLENIGLEKANEGYVESMLMCRIGEDVGCTRVNDSHGENATSSSSEPQLPTVLNKRLPWMRLKNRLPNYFTKASDSERTKYKTATLVYLYSPRSVSTVTKVCLRKAASMLDRRVGPDLTECNRVHFKQQAEYDVLMGDTAFGVCENSDTPCAYFTMIRDPYERIVSSYSYCRRKRGSPLCRAMSPWKTSITQWAIHVGNYFFQQLLFHPKFCNKFQEYYFPGSIKHDIYLSPPAWFRQKVILSHMLTKHQTETLIEYCLENLEKWFALVGIVEHYDLSIKMIETVFGIPIQHDCAGNQSRKVGQYANLLIPSEQNKMGIKKLIEKLKQDDSVNRALQADLRIYARFKEIFQRQRDRMSSTNERFDF